MICSNSSWYFVIFSFAPYESGTIIFSTVPCRVWCQAFCRVRRFYIFGVCWHYIVVSLFTTANNYKNIFFVYFDRTTISYSCRMNDRKIASVFFDMLSYTIGNIIFCIFKFNNHRLAEASFLSCLCFNYLD